MKGIGIIHGVLILISIFLFAGALHAGNNLQGCGGVGLNPRAYPANANSDGFKCGALTLSKPQFGVWYVTLPDVNTNWESVSVAATINKRLEFSFGYERIDQNKAQLDINKFNFGQKFLLLNENAFSTNFIPAISVGAIEKITSFTEPGLDESGVDFYLAASKTITQLPWPVILSGGVLSTRGWLTGAVGFDDDRDENVFGNIDIWPTKNIEIGYEFKQGAKFSDSGFRDANCWDAHIVLMPTKQLSISGAYFYTGHEHSTKRIGLGDGVTFSATYAF